MSERVRQALLRPDICHRESEFSDLLTGIRQKLLKAFVPGAESEYTAIVLTGSGTAAVEAALLSSVPQGKRALIITNGIYGDRMSAMYGVHRLGIPDIKVDWLTRPNPETVAWPCGSTPKCMSSAWFIMRRPPACSIPSKKLRRWSTVTARSSLIPSAVSAGNLGCRRFENLHGGRHGGKMHTRFSWGVVRACPQGIHGAVKGYPKRSWYLHLPLYYEQQEKATIPFTPAVQVYYAFDEALNELLEEGVANRIHRFKGYAATIRTRLEEWGVKPVLSPHSKAIR